MSRSVNEVILVGHVGQDPEIRATGSGMKVAKISLATNRKFKDEERTDWHRLSTFGKLADVVEQWVKKGDRLYVRGRIEYSQTESDQGIKYYTDILVNDLVMLGSQGGETAPPKGSTFGDDAPGAGLPFAPMRLYGDPLAGR